MTHQELRDAVSRHIDEYRDAYNETGDERYRAVKNELLHVLGLIDAVDGKPVGNPDKMTPEELAHELRKIFKFRYLTVEKVLARTHKTITLWVGNKPPFYSDKVHEWFALMSSGLAVAFTFEPRFLNSYLDLSEYKDENGDIDYSKCIVEVPDDIK